MPLLVQHQRSDLWWAQHLNRITSSTAAGCLGVCKDLAPISAWKKIKQMVVEKSNWYTEYGHRMEAPARRAYENLTNILIWETGFWVHPTRDWLGASPDGIGVGALEIKCPQTLPSEVPQKHKIQCQVVMAVTELPYCDYFAWNPQSRPDHFLSRIHRDLEEERKLLFELDAFYLNFIVNNVPPPRRKRVPTSPLPQENHERSEPPEPAAFNL